MLAQHWVDVERAANVVGRVNGADFDVRAVVGGENGAHVFGGHGQDRLARNRVARDAAAEAAEAAAGALATFTEEVDVGDHGTRLVAGAQGANVGDQPAVGDLHL